MVLGVREWTVFWGGTGGVLGVSSAVQPHMRGLVTS